jgi:hypothetical protein
MFESKVMRLGQDSDSNSDLKYTKKRKTCVPVRYVLRTMFKFRIRSFMINGFRVFLS